MHLPAKIGESNLSAVWFSLDIWECVCVCVCVCVWGGGVYKCMQCVCVCVCVCAFSHLCVCACMCVCVCAFSCLCVCLCVCVCVCMHSHASGGVCVCVCVFTHVHVLRRPTNLKRPPLLKQLQPIEEARKVLFPVIFLGRRLSSLCRRLHWFLLLQVPCLQCRGDVQGSRQCSDAKLVG